MIYEINQFFIDEKTGYQRGSFASFLLDELREIQGLPWEKIHLDDSSRCYEKKNVLLKLAEYCTEDISPSFTG